MMNNEQADKFKVSSGDPYLGDPYLLEIARIKRSGELDALRGRIEGIKHYFANAAWQDTEKNGRYKNLGVAIENAHRQLRKMRMLLTAMQEIDLNQD